MTHLYMFDKYRLHHFLQGFIHCQESVHHDHVSFSLRKAHMPKFERATCILRDLMKKVRSSGKSSQQTRSTFIPPPPTGVTVCLRTAFCLSESTLCFLCFWIVVRTCGSIVSGVSAHQVQLMSSDGSLSFLVTWNHPIETEKRKVEGYNIYIRVGAYDHRFLQATGGTNEVCISSAGIFIAVPSNVCIGHFNSNYFFSSWYILGRWGPPRVQNRSVYLNSLIFVTSCRPWFEATRTCSATSAR